MVRDRVTYSYQRTWRANFVTALDGGFFVFGDLSVKLEGDFRLKFTLFEMRK